MRRSARVDRCRLPPRCRKSTPMVAIGQFDPEMQMFVDSPRTLSYRHLIFMRYLAVMGRLEHPCAGPSSGAAADADPPKPVPLLDYCGTA